MKWLTKQDDRIKAADTMQCMVSAVRSCGLVAFGSVSVDEGTIVACFVPKSQFDRSTLHSLVSDVLKQYGEELSKLAPLPASPTVRELLDQKAVTDDVERSFSEG